MRWVADGSIFPGTLPVGGRTGSFGLILNDNPQPPALAGRESTGLPNNKTHRPGEPEPMRFEQGLLPCQFKVRCSLPVFSDGRLDRGRVFFGGRVSLREPASTSL
jgi:hypothetical protein